MLLIFLLHQILNKSMRTFISIFSIFCLFSMIIYKDSEIKKLKEENSVLKTENAVLLKNNNDALKSIQGAQESLEQAKISVAKLSALCK